MSFSFSHRPTADRRVDSCLGHNTADWCAVVPPRRTVACPEWRLLCPLGLVVKKRCLAVGRERKWSCGLRHVPGWLGWPVGPPLPRVWMSSPEPKSKRKIEIGVCSKLRLRDRKCLKNPAVSKTNSAYLDAQVCPETVALPLLWPVASIVRCHSVLAVANYQARTGAPFFDLCPAAGRCRRV